MLGMGERKQTIEKETLLHPVSTSICDLTKLRLLRRTLRLNQKTKYRKEQGNIIM